ncbi:MAG: DUF2625 family protein [Clostridium lundense]|nr:DUF2625 family protein [Clostridium lundense]
MKRIDELIYKEESAWIKILEWIEQAKNDVEVLPNSRVNGEKALLKLQITNKSTMGAIVLECGGILVDNGWLRILGSGSDNISGSILSWNSIDGTEIDFPLRHAMIIAYDIIGGFYAINAREFGGSTRNVFYFAPNTLEWEDIEMKYTDFIYWTLYGDLNLYYKTFRWANWKSDIKKLSGNQGISIFPYLWTKEAEDIEKCSRRAVPMRELWGIQNEFARQIKEN